MPRTAKEEKTHNSISDTKKGVKTNSTKEDSVKIITKKDNTPEKAVAKKTTSSKNTSTSKKSTNKKSTTKKSSTVTAKKSVKKSTSKTSKSKMNSSVLEYYDLPYRYDQTMVKILAQTPTTLFVYWDIADKDRSNFIEKYGNDFFNKTKPVLLIHNKTRHYYFEVEINDFANSWYLRMQEPDCEYDIELGRRNIENPSQYIYISSSNKLVSPNDHILFDETDFTNIKFKNIKTGSISYKDFGSIRLMTNIGNLYNKKHKVYSFYNNLYKDEVLDNNKMFSNPSSGNPTSNVF